MSGSWRDEMPRGLRSLPPRQGDRVCWRTMEGAWRSGVVTRTCEGAARVLSSAGPTCWVSLDRIVLDIEHADEFGRVLRWVHARAGHDIPVGAFEELALRHVRSKTTEADVLLVARTAAIPAKTERDLEALAVTL